MGRLSDDVSEASQERQRRRNKRAHLRDYQPMGDGGYQYTGTYRQCEPEKLKEQGIRCLILATIPFLLLLIVGFIPRTGMEGRPYILFPYAIAMILSGATAWKIVQSIRSEGMLPEHRYHRTAERVTGYAMIGAFLALFGVLGLVFDLATSRFEGSGAQAAALGLSLALTFVLLFMSGRKWNDLHWN